MSEYDHTMPAYDRKGFEDRLGRRRALRGAGIDPKTGKTLLAASVTGDSKKDFVRPIDTKQHRDSFLEL